jgi:hypothetical protein
MSIFWVDPFKAAVSSCILPKPSFIIFPNSINIYTRKACRMSFRHLLSGVASYEKFFLLSLIYAVA